MKAPLQTASRYHDISTGHRVVGHENKCRHLHGHNYRVHFDVAAPALDTLGRVMDFGVIKEKLCMWLEENWDHKFLAWEQDKMMSVLVKNAKADIDLSDEDEQMFQESVIFLPFNPTAENMAQYLVEVIGPQQLEGTGCELVKVVIEETRKCLVTYSK